MLSLEYLDLISTIAWKLFEKVNNFQQRFWLNTPIQWNSQTKQASFKPIRKCIPLLLVSLIQIPIYTYSWLIVYRQLDPTLTHPNFPLNGTVFLAFGATMNFFVTWGSLSNFHKRKEWALCLNLIGKRHFDQTKRRKKKSRTLTKTRIVKRWTIIDLIVEGIFLFFIFLGTSGFFFPLLLSGDPVAYILIDIPKTSRTWIIAKFIVRPIGWGLWTFYTTWTFYAVVGYIFFAILHGSIVIPRVPKVSKGRLVVITTTLSNLTFPQRLAINLMEGAYREYRQFQVFIRPANEAMYVVVPDGLAGIAAVSIIGGFATIKGYSAFPLNVYLLFPSIFCMTSLLIFIMAPIACNVFESALTFKAYWLSRFTRKEVRKRLIGCRPMGVAAGPFGYVRKSLPMEMMNAIADSVCSLVMTMSI